MQELLKRELNVDYARSSSKFYAGGCISQAMCYETNIGKIFVKTFQGNEGKLMYDGEFESLKAIMKTNTVRVPSPLKVMELNGNGMFAFAMEFLQFSSLSNYQKVLGENVARLHLHNIELLKERRKRQAFVGKAESEAEVVEQFGFHLSTSCGVIPMDNKFQDNWVNFYARQRIQVQIDLLLQKTSCRQLQELWSEFQLKLDVLFKDVDVVPSLLHGDMWGGNVGETKDGPVTFDPASFYGHHEYDLAIAKMFGGIGSEFFKAYHSLIPKESGFKERHALYKLFHYLNHWNHFGDGYRSQSLNTLKELLSSVP